MLINLIDELQNFALRFYRLNKKRALGKLFGYGKNVCTDVHSGIGNIEFVKDVRTQAVVTRTFNCSKFGPHVNGALGWVIILQSELIRLCFAIWKSSQNASTEMRHRPF